MEIRMKLAVLIVLFSLCQSRRFTRCELAAELLKYKVFKTFLGNWVCLSEKVSQMDTSKLNVSPSGEKTYGLFQIPSKWCKEGKKGGECNVACEWLLDDNIKDDVACAQLIWKKEEFNYWTLWEKSCKSDNLIINEIYQCPELESKASRLKKNPSDSAKFTDDPMEKNDDLVEMPGPNWIHTVWRT